MTNSPKQIDPVAIALDAIDAGQDVRFNGVDLETGARVSVVVERPTFHFREHVRTRYHAQGLVLTLTVEAFKPTS
ncbi:MAG: hypothetical protein M3Y22_00940 [Pseudomonadota bacterium]|nr:hypothetical protein [Pseudomonadota bacterium]